MFNVLDSSHAIGIELIFDLTELSDDLIPNIKVFLNRLECSHLVLLVTGLL